MKNIGFIGSCFALYGYLKYFSLKNYNLYTLERYKTIIKKRIDLNSIYSKIIFKRNDKELLDHCDEIVVARRPIDQEKFINNILKKKINFKKYYFEKPLCPNPKKSLEFLNKLKKNKFNFSIGYLFFYTEFYKKFIKTYNHDIHVNWEFMSYDLKKNKTSWKFNLLKGGGPLRFYGIHLIAILTKKFKNSANITSVLTFKKNTPIRWTCNILTSSKKKVVININTFSRKNKFTIFSDNKSLYNASSPFGNYQKNNKKDYRIKYIDYMISDLRKKNYYKIYKDSMILWKKIEDKTKFVYEM